MSAKKNKRKTVSRSRPAKKINAYPAWLTNHPRASFGVGVILIVLSMLLLTIGYVSNARVGLSMMSLFFGVGLVILANAQLPQNRNI